jgi:alpha-tubulin suppressor-like RCC1 family protein
MVVIKKRVYHPPPERYHFERVAEGWKRPEQPPSESPPDERLPQTPLYSQSWGWNSNGRAGNVSKIEVRSPSYVNRSVPPERYVTCSAGKHHSLVVDDKGQIYAFGEARKGQLGFGNFVSREYGVKPKGSILQVVPRAVTPSGEIRGDRDMKVSQVAAGGSFSVAKEVDPEEGVSLCRGFKEFESRLEILKDENPTCSTILQAWSAARHERFLIAKACQGRVTAWGTGKRGELGMGRHFLAVDYPVRLGRLNNVIVTKIAAGAHHVLAITSDAELYSWGSGSSGRLGHNNFDDIFFPKRVSFFDNYFVEQAAAGDRHSIVVTTSRKGDQVYQRKTVSGFGRGAHGRLGNGLNTNQCRPVSISDVPDSMYEFTVRQIACGGAHTLLLLSHPAPRTRANPWAIKTEVVGFGFGENGQLGTGRREHSLIPVRVRFPKWEIVSEISAGRSWSLARTIAGEAFSWGKGLRGQLGQGSSKFSLIPTKLSCLSSFVRLSGGYAHSMAITAPKKLLNATIAERAAKNTDPLSPLIEDTLRSFEAVSSFAFNCCRRNLAPNVHDERYMCLDCSVWSACILCARHCHAGHRVIKRLPDPDHDDSGHISSNRPRLTRFVPHCQCGVSDECTLLAVVPEVEEANINDQEEFIQEPLEHLAARSIQGLARRYIGKRAIRRMIEYTRNMRFDVCETYWYEQILAPIWEKLDGCFANSKEERAIVDMRIEESLRRKFDYSINLQSAIQGINAMSFGVRLIASQICPSFPTSDDGLMLPSYAFSWASARAQQLTLPPMKRTHPLYFSEFCQHLPRFDPKEGLYFDRDVCIFLGRHFKSAAVEKFRKVQKRLRKEAEHRRELEKRERALDRLVRLGRHKPRPPPPMSPKEARLFKRMQEHQREKEAHEEAEREREDGRVFEPMRLRAPYILARRKTLCDPSNLFHRIQEARVHMTFRGYSRRRDSLPLDISKLHAEERLSSTAHKEDIRLSLELFHVRNGILEELVSPKRNAYWAAQPASHRRRHAKKTLAMAWLNPRLPSEMNAMVREGGRRRTIGEPERLEMLLFVQFEIRNNLSELRARARKKFDLPTRRRSFDLGEIADEEKGITDALSYEYEPPWEPTPKGDLLREIAKVSGFLLCLIFCLSSFSISSFFCPYK